MANRKGIDKLQNVYFSDSGCVRKIRTDGIIETVLGNRTDSCNGDGGIATTAGIGTELEGIGVDDSGNVYVAEINCSVIRKTTTNGNVVSIAGDGVIGFNGDSIPPLLAELALPFGVFVSSTGKIYIADGGNGRIRCVGCGVASGVDDINKLQAFNFSITPNPTSGQHFAINITSSLPGEVTIAIFNAVGELVKSFQCLPNKSYNIELDAPAGYYLVRATTPTQTITKPLVMN